MIEKPVCEKVRYYSELTAKVALWKVQRKREDAERRHYRCKPCRAWHLTSEDER